MKKVKETPIQDKINKSIINRTVDVIDDLMKTIRFAEKEKIIETNNNYYVYQMNYNYIKHSLKFLDNDYFYNLTSIEDRERLKNMLNELNELTTSFNKNIKNFNDSEKSKSLVYRAHLKPLKVISSKHFVNQR